MPLLHLPPHGANCDLNVPYDSNKVANQDRLHMLVQLGYRAVAITKILESTQKDVSNKKKRQLMSSTFTKVELLEKTRRILKATNSTLQQFSRVTIELNDPHDCHLVKDILASRRFDIVAVLPRTAKLYETACCVLNIDIICIDGSIAVPFVMRHTPTQAAIKRGVYFEACYSPMLRDVSVRRHTISNMQKLVENARGKNIIVSSGAEIALDFRAPHDAGRICSLFGIPDNVLPHTVTRNARAAVVHGFSRLTAKYAIYAEKIEEDEAKMECEVTNTDKRSRPPSLLLSSNNTDISEEPASKQPKLAS